MTKEFIPHEQALVLKELGFNEPCFGYRDGIVKPIEEENMKDEYIIINKTAIQKRIEELKYQRELAGNLFEDREYNLNYISMELRVLEQILSQSTPLIPELQKTWNTAYIDAMSIDEETYKPLFFEDYITNLKLDI